MILILHILIAITGIIQASYMLVKPSKKGLHLSYALLALTLTSGTFLVASTGTHILQGCMSGLMYTGFVTIGIARARYVLAKESTR
jgi:predicted tellurium resistance membrane protein TerC